jgi:hypothetical protein
LIAIIIILGFAACANNNDDAPGKETPDDGDNNPRDNNNNTTDDLIVPDGDIQDYDGFYFVYKDCCIFLNEDYEQVSAKIGKANDVFEIPSCAFDGIDRMFYYDDFIISTYPDGDKDLLLTINLTADAVRTPEGVGLGMSFDDMINAYGYDYENNFELYIYAKGDTELSFLFEDDILADINYYFLPAVN